MSKKSVHQDSDQLRKAAEAKLVREQHPKVPASSTDELLHELQVHQIELEMQNKNLREAHLKLEQSRDRYVDLYDFAPVGYLTLSREGLITEANLTAANLLGEESRKLIRLHFTKFIIPAEQDRWHSFFLHVLKQSNNLNFELTLQHADGTSFYAQLSCLNTKANDLKTRVRVTLTDITEHQQLERALRSQQEFENKEAERKKLEYAYDEWINALDAVNDPIFMHDMEFHILRCNDAYQKRAGIPFQQIIGRPYYEIFPLTPAPMPGCLALLEKQEEEEINVGDTCFRSRAFAIRDEQNAYLYSVHVLEDITEQKNNQNVLTIQARIASIFALISNEEQFNEVLKIVLEASSSPFGIFGYLDTDGTFVVPTMTRQVWDQCDIPRKSIRFPREAWGDSSWPRAIREKLSNYSNQPSSSIPEVHVSIQRHISMPILYQGEVIGLFQVANKASDYSETDIQLLSIIAAHVAPLLQAKLQQNISALTLNHANRALETRSLVNRSLVNATEERSLMQAVCQAIVSQRGFRMAWVGYSRHDEDKSIEVMASEGDDRGYLEFARLVWGETERGMGPSGLAIRSGIKQVCQDIAHDPAYLPWRDAALDRGYAAVIALPLFDSEGNVFGILDVYADQLNAFIPSEIKLLAEMSEDLSFGVMALRTRRERNLATKKIQQQFLQLQDNLDNTIKVISTIVEMCDPYTAGHQRRMADLACAIARQMGLPDEQVHGIHIAGIVHDLGKIQIPAEILSKPGKLSSIEYSLIKQHPQAGFDILKGVDFTWPIAQMVLQHHERFDGTGYPQGLKGDATLLEARILGVADVVEALSSHRPYRPGLGIDAALNEITLGRGTHFDSGAVDACLNLFREQGYRFPD